VCFTGSTIRKVPRLKLVTRGVGRERGEVSCIGGSVESASGRNAKSRDAVLQPWATDIIGAVVMDTTEAVDAAVLAAIALIETGSADGSLTPVPAVHLEPIVLRATLVIGVGLGVTASVAVDKVLVFEIGARLFVFATSAHRVKVVTRLTIFHETAISITRTAN